VPSRTIGHSSFKGLSKVPLVNASLTCSSHRRDDKRRISNWWQLILVEKFHVSSRRWFGVSVLPPDVKLVIPIHFLLSEFQIKWEPWLGRIAFGCTPTAGYRSSTSERYGTALLERVGYFSCWVWSRAIRHELKEWRCQKPGCSTPEYPVRSSCAGIRRRKHWN
jgi:hypothetical protein